ncbi:MAG: hypothetical protein Q9199_002342 [Rusavskia elegans]
MLDRSISSLHRLLTATSSAPNFNPCRSTSLPLSSTRPSIVTTPTIDFLLDPHNPLFDMSGFLSSEAERALQGEEEEARRLFYSDPMNHPPPPGHPAYQGQQNVPIVPSQQWPPSYRPGPSNQIHGPSFPGPRPSPYAAEGYSKTTWSSLHPDDIDESSSQFSRSPSPGNPSDLPNFGYPLSDGTSWKCAYPGCTSYAVFTRGCDLRKHYRRHSKTLFCRQQGCPAATEGGFSSRKDRDRHEAKHRPDIPCEWRGCDRVFSRVDNMKDHVRRIHQNKP